jgi:Transposase DDE domain
VYNSLYNKGGYMFEGILNKYFYNLGVALCKSFVRHVDAIASSCSFSTHEIARHVSKATDLSFNTTEKGLAYLLSNENFQIDDTYWRQHINMIFDLMDEQDLLKHGDDVYIQVDFTSNKDKFLIMSASVIVNNRAVGIYFTMRKYPKVKNQYDHKKMEAAFLKGLKHILSKKYNYIIVADRGFGTERFIDELEKNKFQYLIRTKSDLKIKQGNQIGIMQDLPLSDGSYDIKIMAWEKEVKLYKTSNHKGSWYILSNKPNLKYKTAIEEYKKRFKIEKLFQDLKSSGFDIEKSKIGKYSNYKRLLAMTMVAHSLMVLMGNLISVKLPAFLKNSTGMASAILAYFQLEERLLPFLKEKSLTELLD